MTEDKIFKNRECGSLWYFACWLFSFVHMLLWVPMLVTCMCFFVTGVPNQQCMVQATKSVCKKKKNLTSSESPAAKPNLQQPTHAVKKWEPDRGGNGREKTATPRDEKKETEVGMNEKNRTGARGEPGVVRARADRVPPGRLVGALV
jgi:hypothetical protein